MTLFPAADKILLAEVHEELERGYALVEQDAIGPGRHEAFQALLHELKERYLD